MDAYKRLHKIGAGSFGEVYCGCTARGAARALKTVRVSGGASLQGFPNTALREVRALRELSHANIVRLYDVVASGSAVVLVMELMVCDLAQLLRGSAAPLSELRAKRYAAQMLDGLTYMHSRCILHRDLKPSNLLLSPTGVLKIADFGLARVHDDRKQQNGGKVGEDGTSYTHQVATRWYRAPELLFGARHYGTGVDLWAAGCILAELLNHAPLFPGENDINQIYRVLQVLGQPTVEAWPEVTSLPDFNKISFPDLAPVPFHHVLPGATDTAVALARSLLTYNPKERAAAATARAHAWFFTSPCEAEADDAGGEASLEAAWIRKVVAQKEKRARTGSQRATIGKPGLLDYE